MGELIKKYGEIRIHQIPFGIELNNPIVEETGGIIHVQSDNFRLDMSQLDFYKIVTACNYAKDNLHMIKGDYIDE